MKQKALFLDRDGIVNHDPGDYTKNISEFHILPDIFESIKVANQKGYIVVIITNQAGLAKGLYQAADLSEIHNYLLQKAKEFGAEIQDIFYSPYHDDYGMSLSRKPNSQLLEKAIHLYRIDAKNSFMIGDKMRDVEAAEKVGVKGILSPTNHSILSIVQNLP